MTFPKKIEGGFVGGIKHFFAAGSYSLQGLLAGWRLSLAFRQECAVFVLLCFLLWFFEKPFSFCLISLFMWLCVMSAELLNTALEECVDMISREYSLVIKAIKDMGSAAVFLFLVANFFGQLYIFYDDFIALF